MPHRAAFYITTLLVKPFCLFLLSALLITSPTFGQSAAESISAYESTLQRLFQTITQDKTPSDSLLLASFPDSGDEYATLYRYTHPDSSDALRQAYRQRWSLIRERLANGRKAFARQYLLFSRFVDGEEAESYFVSDLPSYVEQHQDTFCAAYAKLRQEGHRLRRVQDQFEACS